jgi:putative nucleotidyltransferase with HDIG domain
MAERFVTCELEGIVVGEPLPCNVFLYIGFRFITYKLAGDPLDREAYERFELKKVKNLFILETDAPAFDDWCEAMVVKMGPAPGYPAMAEELLEAREDARRHAMDIFQSPHPDKLILQTLEVSRNLVQEVMRQPFAVKSISQLQTYSQGTVDHSVNVSVLSVYLAMQMGYSHAVILQHVGMGGLLHDIGKVRIILNDEDSDAIIAEKMMEHPELGARMLEQQLQVPNEVKMIVAQHHESWSGDGFPKKLHGAQIYDLARIVAIANQFDEIVSGGSGSLVERQRDAAKQLDEVLYAQFDPQKLEKALKILRLGI